MKIVKWYDVVQTPFGDKRFKKSVICSCRSKSMAQNMIKLQSNWHTYEIVERTVKRK